MSAVTERERQVEEALTTRKRQIEQLERVNEWLEANSNGRTHHGYGLCVKEHKLWCKCEPDDPHDWSNFRCKCGYELVREGFWQDAEHIAAEHGLSVHSAGRSSGWLIADPQPHMDDWWEHEQRAWLESFAAFALEIEELHASTRASYERGEHPSGEKLSVLMAEYEEE